MNASMEGGVAIVLCLVGAWDGWSNGRSVGGMRLERHNWGNMSDGRPSSLLLLFALTFTVLKAAWFTVLKAAGTRHKQTRN